MTYKTGKAGRNA